MVTNEVLAGFEAFLRDAAALHEFGEEFVDEMSYWNRCPIQEDGYAYSSRVQATSAVKSCVDYVYKIEFKNRKIDRVNHIVNGSPPDFNPTTASPKEIKEMLEETQECRSESCHAMTRPGYDAIIRGIELTRVRWRDIRDGDENPTIFVRSAKGSPEQTAAISRTTMDALLDYKEVLDDTFQNPKHFFYKLHGGWQSNNPWTSGMWSRHSKRHFDGGWHAIGRHSAIPNRLNNGAELSAVSRRARHANLKNTIKYDNLVAADGSVPPVLR